MLGSKNIKMKKSCFLRGWDDSNSRILSRPKHRITTCTHSSVSEAAEKVKPYFHKGKI